MGFTLAQPPAANMMLNSDDGEPPKRYKGLSDMGDVLKGNAVVGQSGGPTAVINQSLVGVIQEARQAGHILDLFGARHGVRGIVNQDFLPLRNIPDDLLERIAQTPAAALGSTRDKPDTAYCEKI